MQTSRSNPSRAIGPPNRFTAAFTDLICGRESKLPEIWVRRPAWLQGCWSGPSVGTRVETINEAAAVRRSPIRHGTEALAAACERYRSSAQAHTNGTDFDVNSLVHVRYWRPLATWLPWDQCPVPVQHSDLNQQRRCTRCCTYRPTQARCTRTAGSLYLPVPVYTYGVRMPSITRIFPPHSGDPLSCTRVQLHSRGKAGRRTRGPKSTSTPRLHGSIHSQSDTSSNDF